MALHFGPFLRRFGPTHSWRCFPFERYNGIIQKIPTNNRYSEREKTMFTRFCMMQNLRGLFHDRRLPEALDDVILDYNRIFRADIRGTFLADNMSFMEDFSKEEESVTWSPADMMRLPTPIYRLLREWISKDPSSSLAVVSQAAYKRDQISRLGQRFQPSSSRWSANSHILFDATQTTRHPSAGRIEKIFSHTRMTKDGREKTQTFVLLKQYSPLPDGMPDPYHEFPIAGGRLFLDNFLPSPVLISIDQVVCHFAHCKREIDKHKCVLALPLDRN
ncbi:hypothetical protein BDN71DRAFT_1458672 [Pleurotus eryngii]|uniref:Uncharacterized protein n=1 Tax=Pleurotus eryngii TaxID=5323 RepID=A0A9P5ZK22_PLEER|nr:hypothetical protein BDN71DRAFT_1458672 [Pleurotus eryngii]